MVTCVQKTSALHCFEKRPSPNKLTIAQVYPPKMMMSFMNSPLLEFGKEKICWSLQPLAIIQLSRGGNILNLAQLWFMSSLAFGANFVTGFVSTGHVCNFEGNFLRVLTFIALTFAFKYICNSSCTKLWNFTYLEKTNLFEHCTASSSVKSIINHENKCNTEGIKDQRGGNS